MTIRYFFRFHKTLVTNRLQILNFNLQIVSIKNLANTVIIIFGPSKISVDSFSPTGRIHCPYLHPGFASLCRGLKAYQAVALHYHCLTFQPATCGSAGDLRFSTILEHLLTTKWMLAEPE